MNNLLLEDIDRGNVIRQVNEYIAKVIADIADYNKDAEKTRSITLTLKFHPSKARRDAEVSYNVDMKPAGHVAREKTIIYLGKDDQGNPIAKTYIPNQQALPGTEDAFDLQEDVDAH